MDNTVIQLVVLSCEPADLSCHLMYKVLPLFNSKPNQMSRKTVAVAKRQACEFCLYRGLSAVKFTVTDGFRRPFQLADMSRDSHVCGRNLYYTEKVTLL